MTCGGYFARIKEHEMPWHNEIRSRLGPSIIKVDKVKQNGCPSLRVLSKVDEPRQLDQQLTKQTVENSIQTSKLPAITGPTMINVQLKPDFFSFGSMPSADDYVVPVQFIHCGSTTCIFFRPVSYLLVFLQMQDQLQKTYRNFKVKERGRFDIGTWCATFIKSQWVRAIILDYDENWFFSVFCVDFGSSCVVSIENVLPLIEPWLSVPKLAIKCDFARVSPDISSVANISKILTEAKEIYISTPHRPKIIPSIMSVEVIYRLPNGKLFNLNDLIMLEKIVKCNPTNQ